MAATFDIQDPITTRWRRGSWQDLIAAEDEWCRQIGAPTAAERMAREKAEKEQRDDEK